MINTEKIDTSSARDINRFITIPYRMYQSQSEWVPPLLMDARLYLNRKKHPWYEHSDAEFFIATRDGKDVGRIAALENKRFNQYHGTHEAQFYFFECENDFEIARALMDRVIDWAKKRHLNHIVGPKGMGPLDGYGILVEGYEYRQMMTMMNYNFPYYPEYLEQMGFGKVVDFVSCLLSAENFHLPERIHSIAERVQKRGTLSVKRFANKRELIRWAPRIGEAYNKAFVNNWEYYPLTDTEVKFVVDNIMMVADYRLIKIITHNEDVVGFLFGFPDVSGALQRAHGRLFPMGLFDLLLDMRRTKWVAINGAGILPEFQGRGGNALLYSEMEKTIKDNNFLYADLTQVAETAVQMRSDLINVGGKPYKNHRVFALDV